MKYKILSTAFLGCVLLVTAGCSNSASSNSTSSEPTVSFTPAKTGSTFLLLSYQFDSTGAEIPSSQEDASLTVLGSGMSYMGKTNVSEFVNQDGDITYFSFESNGDISIYQDSHGQPGRKSGWDRLPIISKGQTSFTEFDTTYDGQHDVVKHTIAYAGEETISILGKSFHAYKVTYDHIQSDGEHDPLETNWIVPELSVLVKDTSPPGIVYGFTVNGRKVELIDYTLK